MKYLVVGGAGYIGSHFVRLAHRLGHTCVVVDNLCRGHRAFVPAGTPFFENDIRDQTAMTAILKETRPDAVLHFAALALVAESVAHPLLYYDTNVRGTLSLVEAIRATSPLTPLIFSSTCAVFGSPSSVPVREDAPFAPRSPYGRTKLMCETLIRDATQSYGMRAIALRYFNACGADPQGGLGERHDPETHLIPNILQNVLRGQPVQLFGDDYPTPDGTCIRDYIHVTDLAEAHVRAATLMLTAAPHTFLAANLGTGEGHSNREVIAMCEKVVGQPIPIHVKSRRPGDAVALYADHRHATELLSFTPRYSSLETIVETAWRWHVSQE